MQAKLIVSHSVKELTKSKVWEHKFDTWLATISIPSYPPSILFTEYTTIWKQGTYNTIKQFKKNIKMVLFKTNCQNNSDMGECNA